MHTDLIDEEAEALFKGLPVVTLPFGDVGASVGEYFDTAVMGKGVGTKWTQAVYYLI